MAKKRTSMSLSDDTLKLLDLLSKHLRRSMASTMEIAVEDLAKKEGLI